MLIELNRFFSTDEVIRKYRVPAAVADEVRPALPVVVTLEDGTRIHLEKETDDFFAEFFRRQRLVEAQANPPHHGRPGRTVETQEIALYADELRKQGQTWKQIFRACREKWPGNAHVQNADQVRATHRRHFPTNKKRSN